MRRADVSSDAASGDDSAPSERRAGLAAGALLLLLILAAWLRHVLAPGTGKALDAFEYHYPSYVWFYGELAHGRLPLWNPYQLCGVPTLATLQAGFLYPPHLVYLLLPTHIAMALSSYLHLALIGVSTFALGLRLRLGLPAALLAGVLVAMRGAQPAQMQNPSMQEAGAWLAVGFLGVLALVRGRLAWGAALLGSATGLSLLAGFPQHSVYSAYAWAFVLGALLLAERGGLRRSAAALAVALGAVALGVMLAGVQLLPALELASVGGRERGTLPLGLMLPFGAAGYETPARALASALASRPASPALAFGFGVVGLLLLLPAFFARSRRAAAIAFASLGLLCLGFALGPATPLFELYLWLPEIGSFRNPWRVLFVTDLCFAIVAGIGLDTLLRGVRARRTAGGEVSSRPWSPAGVGLATGVLLAALFEIFAASPTTSPLPYDADSPLLSFHHEERPVLATLAAREDRVFTLFLGDMGDVPEKLASVFRFRSISDTEIMTLRRQREYWSYLFWGGLEPGKVNKRGLSQRIFYGSYNIQAPGVDVAGVAARSRLIDLAAVRRVLVPRTAIYAEGVETYLRSRKLLPVDVRDRQIVLFDEPRALPRAYLSHRVLPAPEPAALLELLSRPDFDPRETSYVEGDAGQVAALPAKRGAETAKIVQDDLEIVEIEARLTSPGLLVLADSFYPGWQASVDGEPAPILATNHLYRGVALPAGSHRVRFEYRPASVRHGALASGVGLVALGLLAAIGLRRPRG